MPRLSDTMTEGTVARWLKHPGDKVDKGEILLEIETDKATMELEAYESGVLEKILVDEGKTVAIGEPIAMIGDGSGVAASNGSGGGGGSAAAPEAEASAESADQPAPTGSGGDAQGAQAAGSGEGQSGGATAGAVAPGQDMTGTGQGQAGEGDTQADAEPSPEPSPSGRGGDAPQRTFGYGFPDHEQAPAPGGAGGGATASAQPAASAEASQASPATNGEVRASPMARRIAREHGIDLASIQGSGPGGRVIREDVERAATSSLESGAKGQAQATVQAAPAAEPARAPAPAVHQTGPDQEVEEVPLNNVRRITGARMVESLQSAPHFFLTSVLDVTDLLKVRAEVNGQLDKDDPKISVNDMIVKACALTLRVVPVANASFGGDKILRKKRIHVGVAVATERGLTVPVIRDADQKSIGQITRESRALIERAQAGRLTPAEFSGGTFTVSNLGMFGIEHFTAVINPPEAAILAVGAATKEPVVLDGQVEVRDRMRVTLSVDHRVLDGADGARFLQVLKATIESPMRMLIQ
jgi:pyruvate dehydrogenase E2 component (dihydrolipoamide acetyltransferase)